VVIFGYPFTPDLVYSIPVVTVIFALCPWDLYVKALSDLGKAVDEGYAGISWAQRDRQPPMLLSCLHACNITVIGQ
jgi:hypothetical protein